MDPLPAPDVRPAPPRIYCALDTADADHAAALAAAMHNVGVGIKVGLEFFAAHGPARLQEIMDAYPDLSLFLDLKFHDIPNTVSGAIRGAIRLNPAFLTVHAAGGPAMLKAAQDAAQREADIYGVEPPCVLAVTALTSLSAQDLSAVGQGQDVKTQVVRLAKLAQDNGAGGIVCAPHEIEAVRDAVGPDMVLMVPGIRPSDYQAQDDQQRVMSPEEAVKAGANHLVIGRPITKADDPATAAERLLASVDKVQKGS